jgi:hypothetical protein
MNTRAMAESAAVARKPARGFTLGGIEEEEASVAIADDLVGQPG